MSFYYLALAAFIFIFQIPSVTKATEIDDVRYEYTSFSTINADRALVDLSKRLRSQGLEQIMLAPIADTRALAIGRLDGIFLNSDLTEGIFVKFGISPTIASFRKGKTELDDGTLVHGRIHRVPVSWAGDIAATT